MDKTIYNEDILLYRLTIHNAMQLIKVIDKNIALLSVIFVLKYYLMSIKYIRYVFKLPKIFFEYYLHFFFIVKTVY